MRVYKSEQIVLLHDDVVVVVVELLAVDILAAAPSVDSPNKLWSCDNCRRHDYDLESPVVAVVVIVATGVPC